MKKIFNLFFTVSALVAFSMSCDKEISTPDEVLTPDPQEQVNPAKVITISATLVDTKVTFDPSFDGNSKPDGMSHTWEDGDKLLVTDASDSSNKKEFTLTSGAGTATGTFSGEALTGDPTSFNVEVIPAGTFETGNMQVQAKDGDTAHLEFVASATGVTDLTNIQLTESSSIIGIIAKLPDGAAETINLLVIETSTDDFVTSTKLTVALTAQEDADSDGILKVYANVPAGWGIPAGSKMFLRFGSTNANHTVYTRYQEFASAASIEDGKFNYIKMNCSNIDKYAGGADDGTAAHPYLIADKYQLQAAKDLLVSSQLGYFKLLDDIDLKNFSWIPLANTAEGGLYSKFINFDGNGKTISNLTCSGPDYPSLFGVLQGSVKDLTIDKATITAGDKKAGVVAGYIGTGTNYTGDKIIDNVHVTNSEVSGSNFTGCFAGQLNRAGYVISNCSVLNTTSSSTGGYSAGFIAYIQRQCTLSDISVTDCTVISSGHSNTSEIPNDGFAGGIAARVGAAVDFDRCSFRNTDGSGAISGPGLSTDSDNSKKNRFVGGLAGYVQDGVAATFDDCHVTGAKLGLASTPGNNNFRYVGGAFGYLGNAAKVGETTGCTVDGITTNDNVRNYVAGFVSYLNGATVKNCSVTNSAVGNANSGAAGGFIGYCVGGTLYNNSADTDITAVGNPGGFVGWIETTAPSFEKCSAAGDVSATGNNAGGFCGIDKIGASYVECSSSGTVTSTAGYVGGLIGYINADGAIVSKCFSTSTVTADNNYVGGLVGVCESDTIEKSYYNGTVTGKSRVGGILGISLKDDAVTIQNCYSRGAVVGSNSEQRFGGIVGDLGKGGSVENCWSDATVNAGRVCGGIVGLACYQTWADNTNAGNTITGCLAWNPEVKAAQSGNFGSSGSVIGHTSFKNIFGSSYRRPDMDYANSYNCSGGEWNTTAVDQPDCTGSNWAKGTTPGTKADYTYQQPYYGIAAASTATVSSVARDVIGWDVSVWDFSADYPTLK